MPVPQLIPNLSTQQAIDFRIQQRSACLHVVSRKQFGQHGGVFQASHVHTIDEGERDELLCQSSLEHLGHAARQDSV